MLNKITIPLMSVLVALLIFNQFQAVSLHAMMKAHHNSLALSEEVQEDGSEMASNKPSVDFVELAKKILPTGIPVAYGAELGISYDNAAASIPILAPYEQDTREVKLTGEKLERYIKIGMSATCEFCCSAKTMVFPDGRKACGCAHSAAMRGVVAYLLDNTDMTDQEILVEANKLKAVYFPGPTIQKYAAANGLIDTSTQGLQRQVGGC